MAWVNMGFDGNQWVEDGTDMFAGSPGDPFDAAGPRAPSADYVAPDDPWDTSKWSTLDQASIYTGGMPMQTRNPAFWLTGTLTQGLQDIFRAAGKSEADLVAAIRADREASGDVFTEGSGLARRAASILNRAGIPLTYEQLATLPGWNDAAALDRTAAARERDKGEGLFDYVKMVAPGTLSVLGAAGLGPSSFLTDMGVPASVAPFVSNVGTGMLGGGDLGDIIKNSAISQGIGMGADFAAPYVNEAFESLNAAVDGAFAPSVPVTPVGPTDVASVGQSAYDLDEVLAPAPELDFKRRGSFQVADASGDLTGLVDGSTLMPAATPELDPTFGGDLTQTAPGVYDATAAATSALMPAPTPESDPTFGGELTQTAPGVYEQAGMLSAAAMPPAEPEEDPTFGGELEQTAEGTYEQPAPTPAPTITAADLKRYASAAQKLYGILGGEEKALQGAPRPPTRPRPQRPEGELTPEQEEQYQADEQQYQAEEQQFLEQAVEYLGLDLVAMDEAGLIPGTPEYLTYILDQADSVINQVLGDADPEAADFADRLREKSEQEMVQLMRALYVRGQLGALSGSGTYEDPFTGKQEDVALPDGIRVRPNVAAYQRGLARSVDDLAKMSPQEGKRFIGGMLDRRPDLFRMQARRDATGLREALTPLETEEMKRKRRGMFGDSAYFQQELGGMGQRDLDALLTRLVGRDEGRRGAAVEELFGWQPEEI